MEITVRLDDATEHVFPLWEDVHEGGPGGRLWDAAVLLAQHLAERVGDDCVRGKRVVELGAGLGLPGIVAAYQGAHVTLTVRAVVCAVYLVNRFIRGAVFLYSTWLRIYLQGTLTAFGFGKPPVPPPNPNLWAVRGAVGLVGAGGSFFTRSVFVTLLRDSLLPISSWPSLLRSLHRRRDAVSRNAVSRSAVSQRSQRRCRARPLLTYPRLAHTVSSTEQDKARCVELMRLNAAANGVADNVHVAEFEWGRKAAALHPPFDLVLVADCVCHDEHSVYRPLLKSLRDLSGPHSEVLISYKHRGDAEDVFWEAAEECFHVRLLARDAAPAVSRDGDHLPTLLYRLTRRTAAEW